MASRVPVQQEGLAMQALSVALQHPGVAAHQRNICTLLQVCKACRIAVQQSVSTTEVCFPRCLFASELRNLADMTAWLSKHAGLVSTLNIGGDMDPDEYVGLRRDPNGEYAGPAVQAAGRQLVEFALQTAATAAAYGSGPSLRLHSFTSTLPSSTGLLAALPAATLTTLDISIGHRNHHGDLSRLSNLRQLSLNMYEVAADRFDRYICAIGNLRELTKLKLLEVAVNSKMQLLPAQLQQLELDYTRDYYESDPNSSAMISLQHLTRLQQLRLQVESLAAGSFVPGSLQALAINALWPADRLLNFDSLQQVTSLVLHNRVISGDHCAALRQLRQLKKLSLTLLNPGDVTENLLEVAAQWHGLPLSYLKLETGRLTATQVQQLMQHVAAATMLTTLSVSVREISGADESRLTICEHLKPMKHLQSLAFSVGEPRAYVEHDAQHLSALVALTELKLCQHHSGPYLDAATISLLAVALTNLRVLNVGLSRYHGIPHGYDIYGRGYDEHKVDIIAALPVMGRLTTLEDLRFPSLSLEHAMRGLPFLTGLSRLTALEGFNMAGYAVLDSFWDTIKGQQQLAGHA